jgi:hypothetical protein
VVVGKPDVKNLLFFENKKQDVLLEIFFWENSKKFVKEKEK